MKAVVFLGNRKMDLLEQELPELRFGEVLVRVKACGICGTDQNIYHGQPGSAEVNPPIILGHELAGEVVSVGYDVELFKSGDRVTRNGGMGE